MNIENVIDVQQFKYTFLLQTLTPFHFLMKIFT